MSKPLSTSKEGSRSVFIAGAGPAGLTAGAELIENGCEVTIVEEDPVYVGGLARTAQYKGYRFDIGGHRFFSKNQEITDWWRRRLPDDFIKVRRMSRIFYGGKFFDYPLRAFNALAGLGIWNSFYCVLSYLRCQIFPIQPESSFQDWVSNRFGRRLFNIFFKTYTEKVWGMRCDQISADWAAQRIKGLSLFKAVWHALVPRRPKKGEGTIKTLIDQFEYPRLGPGMMWEKTRDDIIRLGGKLVMGQKAVTFSWSHHSVLSATTRDSEGDTQTFRADHFIVSIPLQETIQAFDPQPPDEVLEAATNLRYRDFLTVALMVRGEQIFPDNWIYVHDPTVKLGRIQNFNNWSAELVSEQGVSCLGLEYFCFVGDDLWSMTDDALIELGKGELASLGLVSPDLVEDGCVVRMEKAYPVYGASYQEDLEVLRSWLGGFTNFQVVGRNGMHKYNNQDHSMLTALIAARNLLGSHKDPWKVNIDAEYHEDVAQDTSNEGRAVDS